METCEITEGGLYLRINWNSGHSCRFYSKWLRFNCHCKRCFREFSGLYPVERIKFGVLNVTSVEINDGKILLKFDFDILDDHVITIPIPFLQKNCLCKKCLSGDISRIPFSDLRNFVIPRMEYSSILTEHGLLTCLEHFVQSGFCVLENVPGQPEMNIKIANIIGNLRATLTGKFFDVLVRDKNKYNSVHTTVGLPFHQDLPWYQSKPGVQILHALRFDDSIIGGESQFVDAYEAAEILRREHPDHFKTLTAVPGMYETIDLKRQFPIHCQFQRLHIEVDYFDQIVGVHWNPGVESTVRMKENNVGSYYDAYVAFEQIIRRKELKIKFRMKTGNAVIFNNHRMLHARTEYTSTKGGVRHLQGCYANLDDVRSNYMVLRKKLKNEVTLPNVGTGSTCFQHKIH